MIIFEPISPIADEVNTPLNSEITLRIYEDGALPLDLATLQAQVTVNKDTPDEDVINVIINGLFVNNWTGEFVDTITREPIPIGSGPTDMIITLIKPIINPTYQQGSLTEVDVSISVVP